MTETDQGLIPGVPPELNRGGGHSIGGPTGHPGWDVASFLIFRTDVEAWLKAHRIQSAELLRDPEVILDTWQRHQSTKVNLQDQLWPILALQARLESTRP